MVTNLNLLYVSLFLSLVFLCELCSFISTQTINPKNNKPVEREVRNLLFSYKEGDAKNPTFTSQERSGPAEASEECRTSPAKFTERIRIINYSEPRKDGGREIRVVKDEYSFTEKSKSEFRRKISDNIMPYLNKDADLINKIYDKFLTNYENKSEEKKEIPNKGDKITLMQLENESKESMSRQFRENQRKTKPYLIIHTHKMFPTNINHSFVKRSSIPQSVPCFDDYGMINISPSEEEAELDGYANHPLWIENSPRNARTSKRILESDQPTNKYGTDVLSKDIGNYSINTKVRNDIWRSSENKRLNKKAAGDLSSHKLKISENVNLNEKYELSQKIPTLSHYEEEEKDNDIIPHMRSKHHQNLNYDDSAFFTSDFISSPDGKHRNKYFLTDNGVVVSRQRKKHRKNKEKYIQARPRSKKIKHNYIDGEIKKFNSHKKIHSRFRKHLKTSYNSLNNYPDSLSNKNEETNLVKNNLEETKDIWNKINYVSSFYRKNGDRYENNALNENRMPKKSVHFKYSNNKNEDKFSHSNLSQVRDKMRLYHNKPDFEDLNIAEELTPIYSIPCERTCENTTPNCKSTPRICPCKFTFPPE